MKKLIYIIFKGKIPRGWMPRILISLSLITALTITSGVPVFAVGSLEDLSHKLTSEIDTTAAKVEDLIKYTTEKFSDVQETDWYTGTVSKLVDIGIINGYPDGTFKPDGSINADAFIKMTVTALEQKLENGENYWAEPYIEKAKEIGLIDTEDFSDYTRPINRGQIAKIIIRALEEEYPDILEDYTHQIKDYDLVPHEFKSYVLKAYVKGIVTGYPDGSFGYDKNATRAEASTMLIRMLDEDERMIPGKEDIAKRTTELTKKDIERLKTYECYKRTYDGKVSANYKSFEEKYQNDRNDAEYIYKNFYPKGFEYSWYKYETNERGTEYLYTDADINWLSSPKLVHDNPVGSRVIRGILQLKYPSNNNKYNLKANTWYEVDVEYSTHFTTDGNYIQKYKYLSKFKEVN